jgi:shikimate dehydrogenase
MSATSFIAGLIGSGVGPSLTPPMHEREGARHGLRYVYRTVDIAELGLPAESVTELVSAAGSLGFDGLNITHPCKQLVLAGLDDISPEARAVGAVNTVVFDGGRATGHNTDVTGFTESFRRGLPQGSTDTVVQVGAGGAGAAVAQGLIRLGVKRLILTDLDPGRAEGLVAAMGAGHHDTSLEVIDPGALHAALLEADGVVNATPVGMAAHPGSAVPVESLRPTQWVADIVYRPIETELVRGARARGCQVLTGAGMAVFQAVDAFALITGREPDAEAMFADFAELVAQENLVSNGVPDGLSDQGAAVNRA